MLVDGPYTSFLGELGRTYKTVWKHQRFFLMMGVIPFLFFLMHNLPFHIEGSAQTFLIRRPIDVTLRDAILFVSVLGFLGFFMPAAFRYLLTGDKGKTAFFPLLNHPGILLKSIGWLAPIIYIVSSMWMFVYILGLLVFILTASHIPSLHGLPGWMPNLPMFLEVPFYVLAVLLATFLAILMSVSASMICPAIANGECASPSIFVKSFKRVRGNILKTLFMLVLYVVSIYFALFVPTIGMSAILGSSPYIAFNPVLIQVMYVVGHVVTFYALTFVMSGVCVIVARFYWLAKQKESAQ